MLKLSDSWLLALSISFALCSAPAHAQFSGLLGTLKSVASSLGTTGSPTTTVTVSASDSTASGTLTGTVTSTQAGLPAATAAQVEAALRVPLPLLESNGLLKGSLDAMKGRRFYVSEYRVMFEQGGSITANTRAAYLGGTNYGATRMTVRYAAPAYDLALLQAVTDRAYADFLDRLVAVGAKAEPAEAFTTEFGRVYENTEIPSQAGAPVIEESSFGHGKRSYVVMAPTGMKLHPRGLAGLGAGNISNRIAYGRAGVDAITVVLAVNIAAQESSGNASSLFRRGSSANASAAMEVVHGPNMVLLQGHAASNLLRLDSPLAVPGQFANFRETGGYDTRQDAAMVGLTLLGNLAGRAVNQSKSVDMAVDVDPLAMASLALQGLSTVNQAIAGQIK